MKRYLKRAAAFTLFVFLCATSGAFAQERPRIISDDLIKQIEKYYDPSDEELKATCEADVVKFRKILADSKLSADKKREQLSEAFSYAFVMGMKRTLDGKKGC